MNATAVDITTYNPLTEVTVDISNQAYIDFFEGSPSLQWSLLFYKQSTNKSVQEILKARYADVPVEYDNHASDAIFNLEFIPYERRMMAVSIELGVLYVDDSTKLDIFEPLTVNPELQSDCLEKEICLYQINDTLIIAVTDLDMLKVLMQTQKHGLESLPNSALKECLYNYSGHPFQLISATKLHTKQRLKQIDTKSADPNIGLTEQYAALEPIIKLVADTNCSFVRCDLNGATNDLMNVYTLEDGSNYSKARVSVPTPRKLVFAVKAMHNLYESVCATHKDVRFLNLSTRSSLLHIRTKQTKLRNGVISIVLEVIHPIDDTGEIRTPIFSHSNTAKVKDLLRKSVDSCSPTILIFPKNRCLRYSSDLILKQCIERQSEGDSYIAVNQTYYRYVGHNLLKLDVSEIMCEDTMHLYPCETVAFGALVTNTDLTHAVAAIKNLQSITAVTHIPFELLPNELKPFAKEIN